MYSWIRDVLGRTVRLFLGFCIDDRVDVFGLDDGDDMGDDIYSLCIKKCW